MNTLPNRLTEIEDPHKFNKWTKAYLNNPEKLPKVIPKVLPKDPQMKPLSHKSPNPNHKHPYTEVNEPVKTNPVKLTTMSDNKRTPSYMVNPSYMVTTVIYGH